MSLRNKRNKKYLKKLNDYLEIPREISDGTSKIVILGFDSLELCNYEGIIEYSEMFIQIKINIGIVKVYGDLLELIQMKEDELKIVGKVEKVEFESNKEEN